MTEQIQKTSLSFNDLIKTIILYPKSFFNYAACNSNNKYYWVFLVLYAFLDTVKSISEEYSIDTYDFLILLMAIIPIKVILILVGQLLLLFLLFGMSLAFGGEGRLKEFIKINSYTNLPLIIASIFGLLIYMLDSHLHFINKLLLFTILIIDVISILWSAYLWVLSVSTSMKLTYSKSVVVSVVSLTFLLFVYFIVLAPYAINQFF